MSHWIPSAKKTAATTLGFILGFLLTSCGISYHQHPEYWERDTTELQDITLRVGEQCKLITERQGIAIAGGYFHTAKAEKPGVVEVIYENRRTQILALKPGQVRIAYGNAVGEDFEFQNPKRSFTLSVLAKEAP